MEDRMETTANTQKAGGAAERGEPTRSTQATQGTDLHKSKIPPDDPRLRAERPRARTLRKAAVLAAALAIGLVVAIALVVALAGSDAAPAGGQKEERQAEVPLPTVSSLPDAITDASVGPGRFPAPGAGDPDAGATPAPRPIDQRIETLRQAREEEISRARGASVLVAIDEHATAGQQGLADQARCVTAGREGDCATSAAGRPPGAGDPGRSSDANLQERKNDFLTRAGVSGAEYLDKPVTRPRSPYEVKAGTVIPTVLITGINSDLPGQIVAQVREHVFDTVSGNHLLVPQGSRLVAAYDSTVAWGQERVLVCWNRLIRPDGSSVTFDCMPGVDLGGTSGFADQVDNHWWRIITGAVFSSVLAATAQRSQGDVGGFQPTYPQLWASNAAGQINQSGQQITQKNLQIQPTITIRPGFSVNVLVTKDIVIAPYSPKGGMP
jgi:type IV secretion system protein TrbI